MGEEPGRPSNPRRNRRREERRLLWAVILFLVVVGGLVIGAVYGLPAVLLGSACLLTGAGVLLVLWLILLLLERLSE